MLSVCYVVPVDSAVWTKPEPNPDPKSCDCDISDRYVVYFQRTYSFGFKITRAWSLKNVTCAINYYVVFFHNNSVVMGVDDDVTSEGISNIISSRD